MLVIHHKSLTAPDDANNTVTEPKRGPRGVRSPTGALQCAQRTPERSKTRSAMATAEKRDARHVSGYRGRDQWSGSKVKTHVLFNYGLRLLRPERIKVIFKKSALSKRRRVSCFQAEPPEKRTTLQSVKRAPIN